MILAIDAGNTNIVCGILDREQICYSWRLSTDRFRTADEYSVLLRSLLTAQNVDPADLEGAIL